jgi:hypothetical protein
MAHGDLQVIPRRSAARSECCWPEPSIGRGVLASWPRGAGCQVSGVARPRSARHGHHRPIPHGTGLWPASSPHLEGRLPSSQGRTQTGRAHIGPRAPTSYVTGPTPECRRAIVPVDAKWPVVHGGVTASLSRRSMRPKRLVPLRWTTERRLPMVFALLAKFLLTQSPLVQAVVLGLCTGLFVTAMAEANERDPAISKTVWLVLIWGASRRLCTMPDSFLNGAGDGRSTLPHPAGCTPSMPPCGCSQWWPHCSPCWVMVGSRSPRLRSCRWCSWHPRPCTESGWPCIRPRRRGSSSGHRANASSGVGAVRLQGAPSTRTTTRRRAFGRG